MRSHSDELINLQNYRFDGKKRTNIISLFPPLPKKDGKVDFDICDYEMLFNDPATDKIIREGKTIGCFYIESPGMRSLLRRLNAGISGSFFGFEMLTAASSIIRPGVAESGMMQEFIARHKNPKRRKYLIPEMKTYLGETYGVMIYQEDVIKVAHHIAGLTLEEADLLRRAMSGKMRSHVAMKKIEERFWSAARNKGLNERVIKELWRQIESFAGYAFCKAHSASFALLSFQVAFLKAHYPAEFMSSVLSNGGGYYSPAVYVQECKRLGLKVLLPCVNESSYGYTGDGKEVRIGLMAIKHLSSSSAHLIEEERKKNGKYSSLLDFLVRTSLGLQETTLLIKCGAMDCFNSMGSRLTRPVLLRLLDVYMKNPSLLDERKSNLFTFEAARLEQEIIKNSMNHRNTDFTIEEKCRYEYELFDFMVTRHPLEFFPKWVNDTSIIKSSEMYKYKGKKVKMLGWYMASKRVRTKKGDIMKFLSLEDLTGTFEAVIFPKVYNLYAETTLSMGPFVVEGIIDADNTVNIITEKIEALTILDLKASQQKDSVENKYYGDEEKVTKEELDLMHKLGKEKLIMAYAG